MILVAVTLGGCVTDGVVSRQLPPASSVVLDPAPKSDRIGPGIDARVAWKLEEQRADGNARRLVKSRQIYEGVRQTYGEGR